MRGFVLVDVVVEVVEVVVVEESEMSFRRDDTAVRAGRVLRLDAPPAWPSQPNGHHNECKHVSQADLPGSAQQYLCEDQCSGASQHSPSLGTAVYMDDTRSEVSNSGEQGTGASSMTPS